MEGSDTREREREETREKRGRERKLCDGGVEY